MKKLVSCEFNMDTVCVELRLSDGSMISIWYYRRGEWGRRQYVWAVGVGLFDLECTAGIKKFGAKVYKISRDKNDRLTRLNVTDGALSVRDEIKYGDFTEKINQIRIYQEKKYVTINNVEAGILCAVTGLSKTSTGQGLGGESDGLPLVLELGISYRIILPDGADPRVVLPKLKSLEEEDPQLRIKWSESLSEFSCEIIGTV